jgi:hypothetical protein
MRRDEMVTVVRRATPSPGLRIIDIRRVYNSSTPRLRMPGSASGTIRIGVRRFRGIQIGWSAIEMFPAAVNIHPLPHHAHNQTHFLRLLSSITHLIPSMVQLLHVTSPSGVT